MKIKRKDHYRKTFRRVNGHLVTLERCQGDECGTWSLILGFLFLTGLGLALTVIVLCL